MIPMQMIVLTTTTKGNSKRQLTGKEIGKKMPIAEGHKKKRKTGKDSLEHWKNIKPVLLEIMAENNGDLPDSGSLRKNGFGGVAKAITKHHHGFIAVREKLGLKQKKRSGQIPSSTGISSSQYSWK